MGLLARLASAYFVPRNQPDAGGANNYAFLPGFGLPPQTITGFAYGPVPYSMRALQPPQIVQPQQIPLTGITGVVAGGIYTMPLGNNPNEATGT